MEAALPTQYGFFVVDSISPLRRAFFDCSPEAKFHSSRAYQAVRDCLRVRVVVGFRARFGAGAGNHVSCQQPA